NSASPNDERGFNKKGYPNGLSLRSWNDPTPVRASNANDRLRGSTALALIFDPEWNREAWKTESFDGVNTKITGPATGKITDKNSELHTGRYWLYDPVEGVIKLQDN
ncbi:MAG: hypothetical protein LBC09_06800, partial [Helicobacteraceae bacterium]|nr:hypothetical protein [Helicobacteraceae bacterium]